jgi:hypothetical protein
VVDFELFDSPPGGTTKVAVTWAKKLAKKY